MKREIRRLDELLSHERLLAQVGVMPVAGVDEVGMGPLAGPVVAAAVILPVDAPIEDLDDSKALNRLTRERLEIEIRARALAVGLGVVAVDEIDEINIYQAGLRAMERAVAELLLAPRHLLIDARTLPRVATPQTAFVHGDRRVYSIAAASIVAKVYRDRLMADLDQLYPGYGFAQHAGYGTAEHRARLRTLGPSPAHRRSFKLV